MEVSEGMAVDFPTARLKTIGTNPEDAATESRQSFDLESTVGIGACRSIAALDLQGDSGATDRPLSGVGHEAADDHSHFGFGGSPGGRGLCREGTRRDGRSGV